jgi:3-oxoacyl-[acyl-carrier protein] reductase
MSIDSAKVALITGAGRGIGRSVAIGLAQAGMDVVLMARTAAELEETRGHVAALGRSALAVRADVGCPEEVRAAVDQALERFGRIDVLVNAAGRQPPIGPLAENDAADWAQTIQVNLLGTFHCIQAVLPGMRQRRAGKIINFSGGGATSPRPNFSAYAVSKAAVVRLTETLAEELKPYNIQVNAVAPGAVNTRMLEEVLAAGTVAGPELNEAQRRKERGGTPPELAAALVAFLASEASDALTGKLISAPHDDWQDWDAARIAELMPTPMYTLRRLDAHTVKPLANRMRL